MRYYVYALIDPPRKNTPFYIGKGLDNRLQSHFKEAESSRSTSVSVIGCDTESLLADAQSTDLPAKVQRINALAEQGFNHTSIARVIARRLDERTALAVEACLIRNVFGIERLTNRVEGSHAERFRRSRDNRFIPGLDFDDSATASELAEIENRFGRYYVYTLRNPETEHPFYVGKGTGRRLLAHFEAARTDGHSHPAPHVRLLAQLLHKGHQMADIGRIEARLNSEQEAFAIEALLIKFVYGFPLVDNRVAGHHCEMFRAKDDWEARRGFDLPYVCDPGMKVDRSDKRDGMIGEGLAIPLLAIAAQFPELNFDPPKVLDASELGIEADIQPARGGAGTRIKLFIRRSKLQVELRPRRRIHRDWTREHFTRLGFYPLRRADDVFFPDHWRGPHNMTDDLDLFAHRIRLMQEIVNAQSPDELSSEARQLLTIIPESERPTAKRKRSPRKDSDFTGS